MTYWEDMSKLSRVLVILVLLAGFCLFLFRPTGSLFLMVFLSLVLATVISTSRDNAVKDRLRSKEKEDAEAREPRIKGSPLEAAPQILADNESFELLDVDSGRSMGRVDRALLEELIKAHESWGLESNDFFIMEETAQYLEETGASKELVLFLKKLMDGQEATTVRWVIAPGLD